MAGYTKSFTDKESIFLPRFPPDGELKTGVQIELKAPEAQVGAVKPKVKTPFDREKLEKHLLDALSIKVPGLMEGEESIIKPEGPLEGAKEVKPKYVGNFRVLIRTDVGGGENRKGARGDYTSSV